MRTFLFLVTITVLASCSASPELESTDQLNPSQMTAQAHPKEDVLLAKRLGSFPKVRPWPISWFEPKETISGASEIAPLEARKIPLLGQSAWDEALDYARGIDTDYLYVWKDGELDRSWQSGTADPAAFTNTYYLNYFVLVAAVGIAIDDGTIDAIDIPVSTYLTEWAGEPRGEITLRNLLEMNAGLEMYADNLDPADKAARLFFGSRSTQAALEYDLKTQPGTLFEYNYVVPELVGIILERATGQRYADYMSAKIWTPLGNHDAAVWLDGPGGRPHFNAALFARAEDWVRFAAMLAQGGAFNGTQIVPKPWLEQMQKPSMAKKNYGFVWLAEPYEAVRKLSEDVNYKVSADAPFDVKDWMIFDGYGGQRLYVSPSQNMAIVRIGAVARKGWDDSKLPNIITAGLN